MKRFLIVACIILLETSSCIVLAQTNRVNNKQIIVDVEYSEFKREINVVVFNLPGNKGIGTFIRASICQYRESLKFNHSLSKYISYKITKDLK